MRYEAKRYLPVLLKELALRHGFSYNTVKIHNSRSRWGSCTSRKNINLSLSLMLVQRHLVEYVLLHELCHTVEMNHGERFWALMSKVTDGKARALRGELKRFKLELIKA
jgi:predicted metal-dependent hydrolase